MRVLHAFFNVLCVPLPNLCLIFFVLTQIILFSEKRASLSHAMSTEHATCLRLVDCTALAHKALKSFGTSSPLFFSGSFQWTMSTCFRDTFDGLNEDFVWSCNTGRRPSVQFQKILWSWRKSKVSTGHLSSIHAVQINTALADFVFDRLCQMCHSDVVKGNVKLIYMVYVI